MKNIYSKGKFLLLPVLIWFFYSGLLLHNYGRFRTGPEPQNYFRNLAASFLQGRLDIDCPENSGCYDILKYEGKNYLYWPPAPALIFYTPIVAVMGVETPDKLISSLIGILNIFLFSILLHFFAKRFAIPLRFGGIALLTLFWGMGTVHFYMSMKGSIWCMAQVCAQTFLLLSFLFASLPSSRWRILLSGIFFGLACYTRNHLIFSFFALAPIIWHPWDFRKFKQCFPQLILFGLPFLLLSFLNLWYNHARFGDAFNNGMEFQLMSTFLADDFQKYGFFNFHYFPKNVWVQLLSPPIFTDTFPFFTLGWDKIGFSFFWASPLFLLILPSIYYFLRDAFKSSANAIFQKSERWLMSGLLLGLLGIASPTMLNITPGWRQFASRYSLDYQLLMILLGLFILRVWGDKKWFAPLCGVLVFFSLYVNYFGTWMFLNLGK